MPFFIRQKSLKQWWWLDTKISKNHDVTEEIYIFQSDVQCFLVKVARNMKSIIFWCIWYNIFICAYDILTTIMLGVWCVILFFWIFIVLFSNDVTEKYDRWRFHSSLTFQFRLKQTKFVFGHLSPIFNLYSIKRNF